MVYIHKYFKFRSILKLSNSELFFLAASCVFLAAKVLYTPFSLSKAAMAFFDIEKRRNPSQLARAQFSFEREQIYKRTIEDAEFQVLETLSFDLEYELPYIHINGFCEKFLSVATKQSILENAIKFCNDSFKLPLVLLFHPKIIAAACIKMAVLWRKKQGLEQGLTLQIGGHSWFKWIDSAIE